MRIRNTGFKAYVVSASTKHADIPHILFDYHAEGGSKKLEKLDSKAVLSIPELFNVYPDSWDGNHQESKSIG